MVGKDTDSLTSSGSLFKRTLWRRSNNTAYVPIGDASKNKTSSNDIPDLPSPSSTTSPTSENGSLTNATGVDFLNVGFQSQDANYAVSGFTGASSDNSSSNQNTSSTSNINGASSIVPANTYPTPQTNSGGGFFRLPSVNLLDSHIIPDMSVFMKGVLKNKRHEDLREMLDSNKDNLKLEAMKRIIGMVAKGKDAGELFPPVVKNVVCKNVEVKKLVYVYLERYAEEHQDLALLSVSTFQKALKDPNQLIRASALRVLSSIRVPVISPIMLLAIKEACGDMSPFVRKSAANAIPKLYNLDPDTKDELIGAIEKLLADKTTLVAGSAIYAFEDLCPDRLDLIHKHYRRLCSLLIDVDEWGQVVVANMLIRYARTQFLDPNDGDWYDEAEEEQNKKYDDPKKFLADTSDEESDEEKQSVASSEKPSKNIMDPDHRLLLRNAKPLLQSRNSAVVMTVCQMYYCLAPRSEISVIVKPMIRLLKSHREIQAIMLNTLVTFSKTHKNLFEPYLKSFYIRANDPTHVKLLKLEIITNLASEASIGIILKEFQAYVHSSDPKFVAATIHAIGRCATTIAEVSDQCLHGLMGLMASKNEIVVAESVVVTKKLLQQKPDENLAVIIHMAKMIDKITIPMARASILWMLGENCDKVQKYAPDVLRKFAKSFPNEEDIVKLQVVNLAAKLYMTSPKQVDLLVRYVLNLAKFDENYDIRDRARLIRNLILPANGKNNINKHAKKILFCEKPAPVLASTFQSRNDYRINTLSHYLNQRCSGYMELPDWPVEKPDESVRNVVEPVPEVTNDRTDMGAKHSKRTSSKSASGKDFYSDEEDESEEEDEEKTPRNRRKKGSSKSKGKHRKSKDDSDEESESEESEEESSDGEEVASGSEDEEESSENEEDEEESSEGEADESESEDELDKKVAKKQSKKEMANETKAVDKHKITSQNGAQKKKDESEEEEKEDEEESSSEEESEDESSDADETDAKANQKKTAVALKDKKATNVTSKTSTPPLIGSNRSTPPPSSKAGASKQQQSKKQPVSRKDESSSSDERDEDEDSEESSSEEEERKPVQKKAPAPSVKSKQPQSENSKSIKDAGDTKSASNKVSSKSKTKKDESKQQKDAEANLVEEATLLSFDDVPDLPSGGATQHNNSEDRVAPIKARPMLPTLVSQSSEDRSYGMIAQQVSTDGSSPGETLEPLVSSPSALHAALKGEEIEVVNRLLGKGLSVKARFTRKPFIYDEKKVSVELLFSNSAATDDAVFSNIAITDKKLPSGMSLDEFPKIGVLGPGQQQNAYIGIDFCDSLQPAHFTLSCTLNDDNPISHNIQLGCSVGNLLRPCTCSESAFLAMQGKLTGMNENEAKVTFGDNFDLNDVPKLVYTVCNVGFVPSSDHNLFMFAAKTVSTGTPVLITLNVNKKKVTVNCEKMVIGSKLVKELKEIIMSK